MYPSTLKLVFNGGADVRRLRLDPAALTFAELTRAARDNGAGAAAFAMSFQDDENDTIAIRNDADWREALRVAHDEGRKSLKVFTTPTTSAATPAASAPIPAPKASVPIYPTIPAAATPAPTNTPAPSAAASAAAATSTLTSAPVERMAKKAFHLTISMIFILISKTILFGFIKSLFGVVGCAVCAFFKLIPLLMLGFAFRKISRVFPDGHSPCTHGSNGNDSCGGNSMPCMMWKRRMRSGRCGRFRWNWAGDSNNSHARGTTPANPWAHFSAPGAEAAPASPTASAPSASAPSSSTPEVISADSIKHIVAMGFDEADARAAIAACGSVTGALDALLGRVQ